MARKTGRPSWFKMFGHAKPIFDAMSDEDAGKVIKAALRYFDNREAPMLGPTQYPAFCSIKNSIDECFEDYARDVANGQKGGRPLKREKPPVTLPNPSHPMPTHTNAGQPHQTEADAEAEVNNKGYKVEKEREGMFSKENTATKIIRAFVPPLSIMEENIFREAINQGMGYERAAALIKRDMPAREEDETP